MSDTVKAGFVLSLLIFLVGAMLGTIRLTVLVPYFGPVLAVMIELPIILAITWNACAVVLQNIPVAAKIGPRLIMGAAALAFLLLEEFVLSTIAFGQSPADFIYNYATLDGIAGLIGQLLFGLIPTFRLVVSTRLTSDEPN